MTARVLVVLFWVTPSSLGARGNKTAQLHSCFSLLSNSAKNIISFGVQEVFGNLRHTLKFLMLIEFASLPLSQKS